MALVDWSHLYREFACMRIESTCMTTAIQWLAINASIDIVHPKLRYSVLSLYSDLAHDTKYKSQASGIVANCPGNVRDIPDFFTLSRCQVPNLFWGPLCEIRDPPLGDDKTPCWMSGRFIKSSVIFQLAREVLNRKQILRWVWFQLVSCPDPALSRGKKGLVTFSRFLGLH